MKKLILILILGFIQNYAQANLSSNLYQDMDFSFNQTFAQLDSNSVQNLTSPKKSVALAAGLSVLLPGAGQFYNEDYWRTAIYIGIEVVAIATIIIYNKKGDEQTEYFESFANENWSVERYADWTLVHINELNPDLDVNDYNIYDGNGNLDWSELNRLEQAIGSYYSHQLAPFGDQQYYEMIGKYTQFNVGWSDFDGGDYNYGDPVTPLFEYYSIERGEANELYNIARWGSIVVLSNHIISAVEAAFTTNYRNKHVDVNVELKRQTINFRNEYYPQINLRIKI